jgi:hypothetical protein
MDKNNKWNIIGDREEKEKKFSKQKKLINLNLSECLVDLDYEDIYHSGKCFRIQPEATIHTTKCFHMLVVMSILSRDASLC